MAPDPEPTAPRREATTRVRRARRALVRSLVIFGAATLLSLVSLLAASFEPALVVVGLLLGGIATVALILACARLAMLVGEIIASQPPVAPMFCPFCRYDLTGRLGAERCPECGAVLPR